MDPVIDIDQELSAAMQVEPGADFAARVRTRIAADPTATGFRIPTLALGAIGCAAVMAVMTTALMPDPDKLTQSPLLAVRYDMPTTALRSPVQSMPAAIAMPAPVARIVGRPFRGAGTLSSNVIVSRSEMLALQRLFSGATVMPPASEPVADELSIPEISIDPIPVLPGSSGERQ